MTLTRRDGEALVLMSQREADNRSRMLQLAAQLIKVVTDDNGPLTERMSKAFPWMLASPGDRAICTQDLIDAARASFSTDQSHLVLAKLTSWKETATPSAAGTDGSEPDFGRHRAGPAGGTESSCAPFSRCAGPSRWQRCLEQRARVGRKDRMPGAS